MEQLFNDIQQQIADKMGDTVSLIDEDCGQLEALQNGEDQYPVTFPCVLIGIPETLWDTLKGNLQHGKTTVTVRLAFDCYDDTHYGSTQEQHAAERMALAQRLNSALHGWRFDGCATVLIRHASRQFSLPGGIKVYEVEYTTTVADEIQNNES
ncbi:MAG: hypothetical protein EGQ20_20305 [Bacteroides oleiciplenus]|jgi:hypothetical protein|nr:hypothetical protein [Bacteroides oleiciplenus]